MVNLCARILDCMADLHCCRQVDVVLARRVLLKIVYLLTCRILSMVAVLCRGNQPAAAEVLVLRHENAVRAVRPAGCGASLQNGSGSPRWHGLCHAGAGPRCSRSRPRRSWPGIADWSRSSGVSRQSAALAAVAAFLASRSALGRRDRHMMAHDWHVMCQVRLDDFAPGDA
jgi:hypothetical protein